jgi:hypothetical protein
MVSLAVDFDVTGPVAGYGVAPVAVCKVKFQWTIISAVWMAWIVRRRYGGTASTESGDVGASIGNKSGESGERCAVPSVLRPKCPRHCGRTGLTLAQT